ncbi:MAG TPA: DnaJ domain-containing protein [Nitrospiraceae bacterium]|nr:DnaJ domain-containing protein [Nitrospiraceae bacterium]
MENYYSILEVAETATPEEIKQSYRLLLQVWHPDRFQHNPQLLAKAEQKTREINAAFDTLSDPELKQRYDDRLRTGGARRGRHRRKPSGDEPRITRCPNAECDSVLRVYARVIGIVTCTSCRTTFRYDPGLDEKWDIKPPEGNEFFSPARSAMLAIAVIFALIIVFTVTKKSKTIVSYQPAHAHADEQAALPTNESITFKEDKPVAHAAIEEDGASSHFAHPHSHDNEIAPATARVEEPSHEHLNGLDAVQRQMAQASGRAPFTSSDTISAVDLQQLLTQAAQGQASAQNQLGQLYFTGLRGVTQDYTIARGWYEKAAAQGHAWAQTQLGQMYADGRSVLQDYTQARQWWERAAAQGVGQAQYNLAQLYATGRSVPQDFATARGWYEKAAVQGHAWAQAQLGQLYATGRGGPQDYARARDWYGKAAAQGNAWAQAQLALL